MRYSFATRMITLMVTACAVLQSVVPRSEAQTRWDRYPDNPVLRVVLGDSRDPFFYRHKYFPSVLKDSAGGFFRMWFASTTMDDPRWGISYAISQDGVTWFHYDGNSVLKTDDYPAFDNEWVIDPHVILVGDTYFLYYTGFDGNLYKSGLATSHDGIAWIRHNGNPILTPHSGTWESVSSNCPRVIVKGDIFYMFYAGFDGTTRQIGLANSTDGKTWVKFPGNPVLGPGDAGAWDAGGVAPIAVFVRSGVFHLLYDTQPQGEIGLALSDNGVLWRKYPGNPVFLPGGSADWDGTLAGVGLVVEEDSLRMWYSGYGPAGSGGYDAWQIGYAVSPFDTTVLAVANKAEVPGQFSLLANFPNPFNASTVISFELPQRAVVDIRVYDVLGKEVVTLVHGSYSAGRHSVTFEAGGQASGVYYCRVEANFTDGRGTGSVHATRAMALVK